MTARRQCLRHCAPAFGRVLRGAIDADRMAAERERGGKRRAGARERVEHDVINPNSFEFVFVEIELKP